MRYYISEFLNKYQDGDFARFHMPGHKGQFPRDITEVTGADNLLSPTGIIAQSQAQAAKVFGARQTLYSTCGSTACIHAMFFALPANSSILLGRDCHKSVIDALALSGHTPIFALPVSRALTMRTIMAAKLKYPKARAVFVTSPNYYGQCAHLEEICAACGDLLLMVDCAHGAHFDFSNRLPASPNKYADIWCTSAHKTLRALTGGAFLHVAASAKPSMPDLQKIQRALKTMHTTSPSYPVMASLERAYIDPGDWSSHIARIQVAQRRIERIGFNLLKNDDPTRLVIDVSERCTGADAKTYMHNRKIEFEMADNQYIVAITTPFDRDTWYDMLIDSLAGMPKRSFVPIPEEWVNFKHVTSMSIRDAMQAPSQPCKLRNAVGEISASMVGVYPPGIALIMPGEVITAEICEYLLSRKANGATLFGDVPEVIVQT